MSARPRDRGTIAIAASPYLFLLHDLEELLTVPPWLARHGELIPPELRMILPTDRVVFAWAFAFLFVVYLGAALLALRASRASAAVYLFALLVMARLTNVLAHVAQAVYARGYVPGLVTALVVVLPLSVYLVERLVARRWIAWPAVHVLFLGGFVAQLLGIVAALSLGELVTALLR
jgi:hypothetical protein